MRKYIDACIVFYRKYRNFAYVDTHGGSGKVVFGDKLEDGSPLIAARVAEGFSCYVVEIDPDRYVLLKESTRELANVTVFHGDCNEKIDLILQKIPKWKNFVFCFLDPDGLVYRRETFKCPQLRWGTVQKIAKFPRTEALINFPLETIVRLAGYFHSNPDDAKSKEFETNITAYYGTDEWKGEVALDKRRFLEIYRQRLKSHYKYTGAILIRSVEKNLPLYYLVFASNNFTAAKIMHGIMRKEFYGDIIPLSEQPIEDFVYED